MRPNYSDAGQGLVFVGDAVIQPRYDGPTKPTHWSSALCLFGLGDYDPGRLVRAEIRLNPVTQCASQRPGTYHNLAIIDDEKPLSKQEPFNSGQ